MGSRVSNVTFFLDQRRSIGAPCSSRNVFCSKGGQLGPRVHHVTFFSPKDVSWGPVFVTKRFFGSKEVEWGLVFVTKRFLHQRRSVGVLCSSCNVFCTRGGRLGPHVRHITFFGSKEVEYEKML